MITPARGANSDTAIVRAGSMCGALLQIPHGDRPADRPAGCGSQSLRRHCDATERTDLECVTLLAPVCFHIPLANGGICGRGPEFPAVGCGREAGDRSEMALELLSKRADLKPPDHQPRSV